MALAASSAPAQLVEQEIRVEKFAYQRDVTAVPGAETVTAGMIGPDGRMGLLNVTGKPFSATETRHTLQMLANGTKIENSDTDLIYRDDLGRTRIEESINGRTTVVIMDPVARFVAILDRATKTVHKNPIPADAVNGSVSVAQGKVMVLVENMRGKVAPHVAAVQLGDKEVSGVMATGTRETRTIPAGTIGNDRDLQMVDERWYSADLQVLVKSVNTDPRFGETTYQLVNIVRTMQDPALFEIPADYTVADIPRKNLPGK
jgi:hypothetical protein